MAGGVGRFLEAGGGELGCWGNSKRKANQLSREIGGGGVERGLGGPGDGNGNAVDGAGAGQVLDQPPREGVEQRGLPGPGDRG